MTCFGGYSAAGTVVFLAHTYTTQTPVPVPAPGPVPADAVLATQKCNCTARMHVIARLRISHASLRQITLAHSVTSAVSCLGMFVVFLVEVLGSLVCERAVATMGGCNVCASGQCVLSTSLSAVVYIHASCQLKLPSASIWLQYVTETLSGSRRADHLHCQ